MDLYDPVLDQPQVIEFDEVPGPVRHRLANQDLYFDADANSDLYDLHWPWANTRYAASIRMCVQDPLGEELMTLVTRYYAGYQETILGNEGMIISKRLTAPLGSHYDRAVLWTLECQAEGDRLLRLDIEIDWGEPITQRIVDGLLVAQSNPQRAQGIYKQRNAERTCVIGNPQGRPSAYEFDDEGRALLTYYVLVNGIVEVPLLLTISDVGEQVAWSGFLALRDAEREFEASANRWGQALTTGRLWSSDPRLNRAVQEGRLQCLRHLQRLRTGYAPASRLTVDVPDFVEVLDAFDVTLSRNLLAHLRRLAESSIGSIPVAFPARPQEPVADPGAVLADTNGAYLAAVSRHLRRHPDAGLLAEHIGAITLCADSLVRLRWNQPAVVDDAGRSAALAEALHVAAELAAQAGDNANEARWQSESEQYAPNAPGTSQAEDASLDQWLEESGWRCPDNEPWGFADPVRGIRLAGQAVWLVSRLVWHDGALWVYPNQNTDLRWWALADLPLDGKSFTLLWDGDTLHSTVPLRSDQPVRLYHKIRVRGTDEHSFDLQFELTSVAGSPGDTEEHVHYFRPTFDQGSDE